LERIIDIELFGEHYKFKADSADRHAEKAVELLVNKVRDAGGISNVPKNDANRFAQLLLATLNICNEYFDMKDKYDLLLQRTKDRSTKIVNKIDETFK
jgi:cell division protein ZapA (FtsZ GTPase activity inhibitor)